jgi:hypothetical protein
MGTIMRWCTRAWWTRGHVWIAVIAATLVPAGIVWPAPTVLDFEDLAPGTTVRAQYGPRGVLFSNAFLSTASFLSDSMAAHSGTRVLVSDNPIHEFNFDPLVIAFTSPQRRVRLFGGVTSPQSGTLRAFDASNTLVGEDGPKPVAVNAFTTMFEVTVPTPSITRVELQFEGVTFEAIDDLEFEGEAPREVPTTPPVMQILSPANGAEHDSDVDEIDITGTVSGEGLLPYVTVIIAERQIPGDTAPPPTMYLDLTGSGTTRLFSYPGLKNTPGPITITATAENIGGLQGTATSTFTNLPAAIRRRFTVEGGAAAFGDFRVGVGFSPDVGCRIAVYEAGAISLEPAGTTWVIRGDILTKWLALKYPFNFSCPEGEERDAVGGARAQDFQLGRIYARLPAPAGGTAYVPKVFVEALGKRGGEEGNGVPLADPSDSIGPMETWLFQQFFRPDHPIDLANCGLEQSCLLPSTLEIRGTPPTLWMERQAGEWLLPQLEHSAATIWERFPCTGDQGPCTVNDEPPFPPPNSLDAGDRFCNGVTYLPNLEGDVVVDSTGLICHEPGICRIPPEWVAIRGDYVATPVCGAIVSAHMADIDNGLTHETHTANCPYLDEGLAIGILISPAVAVGTYLAAEDYGLTCASDYEFVVHPIGPQGDTSPLPSLFGKDNTTTIHTEYEEDYASRAHQFLGAPTSGDLVHTTGRWIIDCGHETFKSELHPIFSFARMNTVISKMNPFTGLEEVLFGGKPATRVAIWVNGWYPGGEGNAIEFDAFPPPRPSPNAQLVIVKPVDNAPGGYRAAEDVSMEYRFSPRGIASHVHLRFTAPRRENFVSGAGEMKFESGRQYWGIWYLYWD